MSWQNILALAIVLGAATFFVWRSSGSKNHNHGCNCGCGHEDESETRKDKTAP